MSDFSLVCVGGYKAGTHIYEVFQILWDRKDRFKVFVTNGINSFKSDREDRTKQINVFS